MSLDTTVIDMATNKKYTDFSDTIKSTLYNKMGNHSLAKQYANEFDKIQKMKKTFSEIGSTEE